MALSLRCFAGTASAQADPGFFSMSIGSPGYYGNGYPRPAPYAGNVGTQERAMARTRVTEDIQARDMRLSGRGARVPQPTSMRACRSASVWVTVARDLAATTRAGSIRMAVTAITATGTGTIIINVIAANSLLESAGLMQANASRGNAFSSISGLGQKRNALADRFQSTPERTLLGRRVECLRRQRWGVRRCAAGDYVIECFRADACPLLVLANSRRHACSRRLLVHAGTMHHDIGTSTLII